MWNRSLIALVLVSAVLRAGPVFALAGNSESDDENITPSTGAELISPWTNARPWLLGGIGATGFILLFDDQIEDPTQRAFADDRPLGVASKIGDYGGQFIPNAAYSLGMLAYGLMEKDDLSLERSFSMFKASMYAITLSTALKYTIREPRPNDSTDYHSFPSGHTASAFSFAGYVAAEHSLPYGIAALALASLTGLSRINDNRHNLHDVIAGATIGAVYGVGVSRLHRKARKENDKAVSAFRKSVQLVPLFGPEAKGMALVADF